MEHTEPERVAQAAHPGMALVPGKAPHVVTLGGAALRLQWTELADLWELPELAGVVVQAGFYTSTMVSGKSCPTSSHAKA